MSYLPCLSFFLVPLLLGHVLCLERVFKVKSLLLGSGVVLGVRTPPLAGAVLPVPRVGTATVLLGLRLTSGLVMEMLTEQRRLRELGRQREGQTWGQVRDGTGRVT